MFLRTVLNPLRIRLDEVELEGALEIPPNAGGLVLFAHGSGSGRHSPRNQYVARYLQRYGLGTFVVDLISDEEERGPDRRFDIEFLSRRLKDLTGWLASQRETRRLSLGYFGASTGAAAAIRAAADVGPAVGAIVSRGGRPDLALGALDRITAPTMLIVGGNDSPVLEWNAQAYDRIRAPKTFVVVPGATHLFEEPGALEEVALQSSVWFGRHLAIARRMSG